MTRYVCLLRSVNVGGRKYPMAELRAAVEAAGFADVATHIQTGNLLVDSALGPREVAAALEDVFERDRGFAVPTVVLTPAELAQVVADADALGTPEVTRHHVEVLREAPAEGDVPVIEEQSRPGQRFVVRGRAVHLLLEGVSFHEVRGAPAAVRRAMGVSTNRNLTVLRTLAEKWAAHD